MKKQSLTMAKEKAIPEANNRPKPLINESLLENAALIFRAVNNKMRQKMLNHLHKKGGMTVSELYSLLKMEQSITSQHLAILRRAGFVTTKRDGKFIYYFVNNKRMKEVHQNAEELLAKKA